MERPTARIFSKSSFIALVCLVGLFLAACSGGSELMTDAPTGELQPVAQPCVYELNAPREATNQKLGGSTTAALCENEPPEPVDPEPTSAPPEVIRNSIRSEAVDVYRGFYNDEIAVYYDEGLRGSNITWFNDHIQQVWMYMKKTYGSFGPDPRMYVVVRSDKSANYATINNRFDPGFGYRNVIDLGGAWDWANPQQVNYEVITHELAHIVEGGGKNTHESPSYEFWGDGPWPEIFIYDAYKGIGKDDWAHDWYNRIESNPNSNFIGVQAYFFRDWFYPIYNQYGGVSVLDKYFTLLSQCFPKVDKADVPGGAKSYARRANPGEFLHFWSGAAGVSLEEQFKKAFGWNDEWAAQFQEAKTTMPCAQYTAPTASFTNTVTGLSVQFSDTSTDSDGTLTKWVWDFGDGSSSSEASPSKIYAAAGTYTVTLTVTDNGGLTNSSSQAITVAQLPPPCVSPDVEVYMPDAALRAEINQKALGREPTAIVCARDMASFTGLDATGKGIVNLTGLEHATNLQYLGLSFNGITDLTPLTNLTNLNTLYIQENAYLCNVELLLNITGLGSGDYVQFGGDSACNFDFDSYSYVVSRPLEQRGVSVTYIYDPNPWQHQGD
ncbi:MAG: PKD domain-containing protein [Trueperaceae bacterium]